MERIRVWIALAGAAVTLVVGVGFLALHGGGGSDGGTKVVSAAPVESPATTLAPSGPATTTAPVAPKPTTTAVPSTSKGTTASNAPATTIAPAAAVQDVQKVIAAITATVQQQATGPDAKPMTKEEVEAQLRAQLKQLGINY